MRSSLKTRLQETRFWKTLGIFLRATFRPSRGSVTDLANMNTAWLTTEAPKYKKYKVHDILFVGVNTLTRPPRKLHNRWVYQAPSRLGWAPHWLYCCEAEAPLPPRRCFLRCLPGVEEFRRVDWVQLDFGGRLGRSMLHYCQLSCLHRNICVPGSTPETSFHTVRAEIHETPLS